MPTSNYIDGLILEDNNNLINQSRMTERNPLLMMNCGAAPGSFTPQHHHAQQGHYPGHPHHFPTVVGMAMTTGRPAPASCCSASGSSRSGSSAGRSLNRLMNPSSLFRGRKIHNGRGAKAPKTTEPSCMSLSNVYYDPNQRTAAAATTSDRVNNNHNGLALVNGNEFLFAGADHVAPGGGVGCGSPRVDDEVERRNRINRELNSMHRLADGATPSANNNALNNSYSNSSNLSNVATIFRDRNGCGSGAVGMTPSSGSAVYYPNGGGCPAQDYNNGSNSGGRRPGNCRSLDRRRGLVPGKQVQRPPAVIPNYSAPPPGASSSSGAAAAVLDNGNFYADYTEPYQHMMFDANHNASGAQRAGGGHSQDFLRDSSFGSDSGYSQNTQISHRSGGPMNGAPQQQHHHHHQLGANNNHEGSWFRSSRRNVS